ncbi:MAG: hypothetical protein JWO52_1202 [Gammaproteobacteria bacterium]|jgi:hypothetical protein|nr:hypothetical protein [Gammaproteobacteria bacterium]
MNLSPQELEDLTLKATPRRQARVLEFLGIPYRARPDGTLLVLRVHVTGTQDSRPRPRPQVRIDA